VHVWCTGINCENLNFLPKIAYLAADKSNR